MENKISFDIKYGHLIGDLYVVQWIEKWLKGQTELDMINKLLVFYLDSAPSVS